MPDIGFWELLVIGVVALIVVGPEDLPKMFRAVGQFMGRARAMAREFTKAMEDAADDSGLKGAADDLKSLNRMKELDLRSEARNFTRETVMGGPPDPGPVEYGDAGEAKPAPKAGKTPEGETKPTAETTPQADEPPETGTPKEPEKAQE
ncbi:Sec-independent protein translocase protein TatB [Paracoccaceae bacterium GXU_MW_L88]